MSTIQAISDGMSPSPASHGLPLEPALEALNTYRQRDSSKGSCRSSPRHIRWLTSIFCAVVVRFKAVGNAPIMKQNFYKITASNRFQAVIQFLRKELGWKPSDALVRLLPCCLFEQELTLHTQFTYINLAFSPAPDDTVANLYKVRRPA